MHTYSALRAAGLALLMALSATAWADDDHGAQSAAETGLAGPTVTATSASFELVGRLEHDELSLLVDRAASNEPVLNATLALELDGRTALASFSAAHGDYALSDPLMLAALRQVGRKSLLFTLDTGERSEQLRGELVVESAALQSAGAWPESRRLALWAALSGLALALIYGLWRLFSARRKQPLGGAL